jgi:putative toxin-antitoxin system antitoxin component (TIGR02293 family)
MATPDRTSSATSKIIDHIREGYPWAEVHRYQQSFQITDKAFARLIGVSDRTLTRTRKTKGSLDPVASDRFYRTAKVLKLAVDVFENLPRAVSWLQREQPGLEGNAPFSLLDTGPGAQAVETLLNQLEYGVLT